MEDIKYMGLAYEEAKKAYKDGEVPVGAIIVKDGEIIGRGRNRREVNRDPVGHAEIEAIREASKNINSWRLSGADLYVTLEPCSMCAGAIINARISRVIIGARDQKRGCCGTVLNLLNREEFNHKTQVVFGVLEEESSMILSRFFQDLRQGKIKLSQGGEEEFFTYVNKIALKSILYELATTIKPGLVDRYNTGAHKDMDFHTFIDSSLSLNNYFYRACKIGYSYEKEDLRGLLDQLRPLGKAYEEEMFKATEGINTQKGLIFSLGLACAAAGHIYSEDGDFKISRSRLSSRVSEIAKGLSKELGLKNETYGEYLFNKYGTLGIRGEVELGFKSVLQIGLPVLDDLSGRGKTTNTILAQTLLHLIGQVEDSNILGRKGPKALEYAQDMARKVIGLGGYLTKEGRLATRDLDRLFIKENISPGGGADLLAISIFFYILEKGGLNGRKEIPTNIKG